MKVKSLIKNVEEEQHYLKQCNDLLKPKIRQIRERKYPKNDVQYSMRKVILIYEEWKKHILKEMKDYNYLLKQNKDETFTEFQLIEIKDLQAEIKIICNNQKKLLRFLL